MRSGQQERISSVLILLDLSESANDRVGGSMQSILDMEKQSALMLARSTVRVRDRLAIHGFSSNTRADVNYFRLLNFGEPLNVRAEQAIQSVQAEYSTRMGAALRHAARFFADEPSDQHAIVVITDGAPSDMDVLIRNTSLKTREAPFRRRARPRSTAFAWCSTPRRTPMPSVFSDG
jgi:nitric oxide reductase activation protein